MLSKNRLLVIAVGFFATLVATSNSQSVYAQPIESSPFEFIGGGDSPAEAQEAAHSFLEYLVHIMEMGGYHVGHIQIIEDELDPTLGFPPTGNYIWRVSGYIFYTKLSESQIEELEKEMEESGT